MNNNKFFLVLILIGLAIILPGCSTTNIGSKLNEYGFTELRPPSKLIPPGTLITIKDTNPFIVGIICPQTNAFGQNINERVLSSDSNTSTTAKDLTRNFKLDAHFLSRIKGSINATSIDSITVSLSNVKIYELPDDAVIENLKNRSASCNEAVKLRQTRGSRVSMVKSAVLADVAYSVNYNTNIAAEVKAEITKKIAAELGIGGSSVGTDK